MARYAKRELEALGRGELVSLCIRVAESQSGFLSFDRETARLLVDQWKKLMARSDRAALASGPEDFVEAQRPIEAEIQSLLGRMVSFLDSIGMSK